MLINCVKVHATGIEKQEYLNKTVIPDDSRDYEEAILAYLGDYVGLAGDEVIEIDKSSFVSSVQGELCLTAKTIEDCLAQYTSTGIISQNLDNRRMKLLVNLEELYATLPGYADTPSEPVESQNKGIPKSRGAMN